MSRANDLYVSLAGGRVIDATLTRGTGPEWRYQCVSFIKEYLRRFYGLQPGAWGDAKDYWLSPNPTLLTKFDKVYNRAAQADDILVFSGLPGSPGHIALAIDRGRMAEQNGGSGTGSGTGNDAIRVVPIRSDLLGILRPKGDTAMSTIVTIDQLRIIHTEMEGWPLVETHQGKFDKEFVDYWGGAKLEDVIAQKWQANEGWRTERQNALALYRSKKQLDPAAVRAVRDQLTKMLGE